jgi:hypothetical protein
LAAKRVEYRFVLDATFTPETFPMARLAQYMADLAALYGEESAVHFLRLEPGSTAVVSAVDDEADARISERLLAVQVDDGAPQEAKRAYESIRDRAREDKAKLPYIVSHGARVLTFPTGQPVESPVIYGPFWQSGTLTGVVYRVGGRGNRITIKVEDRSGVAHLCHAKRTDAKRLLEYMWGPPVRLEGRGRWIREGDGQWRMLDFSIQDFAPLEHESLTETVARLRAIGGAWKDRPDPVGELAANRGDGEED